MLQRWLRFFRTTKQLQPSQWAWRLRYLVQRKWEASRWCTQGGTRRLANTLGPTVPNPTLEVFVPPLHHADPTQLLRALEAGQLTFLNRTRSFRGGADWRLQGDLSQDRLGTAHLHYHEWLWTLAAHYAHTGEPRAAHWLAHYLRDWLTHCALGQPGFVSFAWNSFNISSRLRSWSALATVLPESFWSAHPGLRSDFAHSYALQAAYLSRHLEWDLRGNHLLRDAVGLAYAGRFLTGPGAQALLRQGLELGLAQLDEQILPDGGHFERSPMYHVHVLEDVLSLVQLSDNEMSRSRFLSTWSKMVEALRWFLHPDGQLALFNDAGYNGVASPQDLCTHANQLGLPGTLTPPTGGAHFAQTGLVIWQGKPWTVFFDVGPVGPTYQPGHAHADTLSVQVSYQGHRLFVDPGTYAYDHDATRRYDRSTAAHNTVCVAGLDSSEVWHIFRVGRRAVPVDVRCEVQAHALVASAAHTGYDHLPGQPRPWRQVVVTDAGSLKIVDRVAGAGSYEVQAGLLLAPDWQAEAAPGGWLLRREHVQLAVLVRGASDIRLSLAEAAYHPEFGCEVRTQRLCWSYTGSLPVEVTVEISAN